MASQGLRWRLAEHSPVVDGEVGELGEARLERSARHRDLGPSSLESPPRSVEAKGLVVRLRRRAEPLAETVMERPEWYIEILAELADGDRPVGAVTEVCIGAIGKARTGALVRG